MNPQRMQIRKTKLFAKSFVGEMTWNRKKDFYTKNLESFEIIHEIASSPDFSVMWNDRLFVIPRAVHA